MSAELTLGEHDFAAPERVQDEAPQSRRPLPIGVLTILGVLALWWGITATGLIQPLFLPSPQAVLAKLWLVSTKGYMDATLWQHLGASGLRIVTALLAAVLLAVPVGVAIGLSRVARGVLDPLIELYRPIPPLAYLPLVVIWFGIGELSKVLLIYLAIFAPIAIATATGVRNVDQTRIRAALSFGATRWQLIRHVILPSALPDILTGIRIGLGTGWSTLVAAELVAATRGLGFMVQSAAQFLVTDVVVLGILVIALIAFALELGLRALQRRLIPWQGRA
ncbi:taurine transport system permease protein [Andreprevotia lacus DSM 23236]|jgi:taurine transport system permease protein|uniref:Taurine transport system permease protein n=1 Tax=Andreprevotia lacus DSM 23236 TaxID=1121001 RepID=A0A1W1XW74_9NEIS|nr:taurine ABC transporter permease TauC [Andreprevotia lacus]SMC27768.1 taurine transport system permease protein [Andreprevotia lacus DSM 23236]